jgi:SAM-dependent methyltransferase
MSRFQTFIDRNKRLSALTRNRLPQHWIGEDLKTVQERLVPELIQRLEKPLVIDVGGGRHCAFAAQIPADDGATLIAMDISEEELRLNRDVALRVAADATRPLPLRDDSVDLLVSRSVVEHLENTQTHIAHAYRCLRKGGYFISVFPSRYSPFALLNRILGNRVARNILFYFHPNFRDTCGFKAYYDRCYHKAFKAMLEEEGFEIMDIRVRYFQSLYYDFFFPAFALSLAYDLTVQAAGAKNLGAQILVVARK